MIWLPLRNPATWHSIDRFKATPHDRANDLGVFQWRLSPAQKWLEDRKGQALDFEGILISEKKNQWRAAYGWRIVSILLYWIGA
ncbi:hypothetical protein GCM10007390_47310 [Persicitalea jodogahamensis]|uniref:Uncharacterized protein n=1 Tax=Persicitalea jodogahamensis TaxID=402147 RepID=A0A8J3D836_9BACT|nr:hypothetical protein GCM10007390_47310 [Persicitalea jodogahamensis]